ncbi:fibronectin type III domain-containing protein [Paractinoplanes rishiriensis]|uniref:Fibronectin type-III domain-containing protein n=1 Tax=Paractinoplanes rishiriensis TaxID=1050105 RepID=A0A919K8G9_9ACTN|nr:fibronectin type III domain-containing protein [Actinoplanes rishiriensis]GIF00429.1 hypothetical protein Ari01nite_78930 [Actinoplanes rishiriensis]
MRRLWTLLASALLAAAVLTVPGSASAAVVFTDDFEGGTVGAWQLTGGQWGLSTDGSRVLRQSRSGAAATQATGGDPAWSGYTLTARVKPTSLSRPQAAAGIAVRAGTDSGYQLVLRPGNRAELVRVSAGQPTRLAEALITVRPSRWYDLRLRVEGDQLHGTVTSPSETVTLTATDTTLSTGAIAMVTQQAAASFDDVTVDTVAPAPDTQPPSAPGRPELLEVTPTTATITWPAATDNVGVTSYLIYLGGQFYEDYFVRQVTTNAPVTVPLGGNTGATLHVSVRAVDAAGNQSWFGPRVTFGQPPSFPKVPGDTVAPTPPGAPVITSGSAGGAIITWAPATDDTGVVEYHVVHAFNIDEVRVRHKVPGNVTSAVVPPASTPNRVWVIAYDAAWNASYSPSVTLTNPTPPPTPPS